MELFRLENTSKITESNHYLITTKATTKLYLLVTYLHVLNIQRDGLRLCKPLQSYVMFCLCAPSPFHIRMVCFPSLASMVTRLFFSVSCSVSCSCTGCPLINHYLVLSTLFPPLLQQSATARKSWTQMLTSTCTAFSLWLIQIPIYSVFMYFPLCAQNKYLFTQRPHGGSYGGSLPKILYTFTNSVSHETECKK